jgi:hypothetical protein
MFCVQLPEIDQTGVVEQRGLKPVDQRVVPPGDRRTDHDGGFDAELTLAHALTDYVEDRCESH